METCLFWGQKGQRSTRWRGTNTLPAWIVALLWVLASGLHCRYMRLVIVVGNW